MTAVRVNLHVPVERFHQGGNLSGTGMAGGGSSCGVVGHDGVRWWQASCRAVAWRGTSQGLEQVARCLGSGRHRRWQVDIEEVVEMLDELEQAEAVYSEIVIKPAVQPDRANTRTRV